MKKLMILTAAAAMTLTGCALKNDDGLRERLAASACAVSRAVLNGSNAMGGVNINF